MANTKAQVAVRKSGQNDVLLIRRSHYRRLLRRIEDLEDALALNRAENSSKGLVDYAEIRERLKRVGKL
jgi:PHD/YefM family antitoxin component YafN of YafNO toxin-antitoxin module